MHISSLEISGFRCFEQEFSLVLNPNLNVIVGENGCGKTAIINAIRQLFVDSESGRYQTSDLDFHSPLDPSKSTSEKISIRSIFSGITPDEQIAFLPWSIAQGHAALNLEIDSNLVRGRYKRQMWGGISSHSAFDQEILDYIHCIYLPPLRDAENKLTNGPQSRIARLLKALCKKELKECKESGTRHPIEQKVSDFNKSLSNDRDLAIIRANALISENLKKAVGSMFSQTTKIQFSENNFGKIVEGLRLLFFPKTLESSSELEFRDLKENSLGYNNLLYIASILAEFVLDDESEPDHAFVKILLIEEPEAHLHPQIQIRLLKYLEQVSKSNNVQALVTTHSTILTSSIPIDCITHLRRSEEGIEATALAKCNVPIKSKNFINQG